MCNGKENLIMKKHLFTVIIVCVFLLGLSLLLYPTVSDWWNTFHQSRAVASYIEKVSTMEDDEYNNILNQAREYNSTVADKGIKFRLSDDELKKYEKYQMKFMDIWLEYDNKAEKISGKDYEWNFDNLKG